MQPGTLVWITSPGRFGTLEDPTGHRFADEVVLEGDGGEYVGIHPEITDWHIIKFDTASGVRYCPMWEGTFEAQ